MRVCVSLFCVCVSPITKFLFTLCLSHITKLLFTSQIKGIKDFWVLNVYIPHKIHILKQNHQCGYWQIGNCRKRLLCLLSSLRICFDNKNSSLKWNHTQDIHRIKTCSFAIILCLSSICWLEKEINQWSLRFGIVSKLIRQSVILVKPDSSLNMSYWRWILIL